MENMHAFKNLHRIPRRMWKILEALAACGKRTSSLDIRAGGGAPYWTQPYSPISI